MTLVALPPPPPTWKRNAILAGLGVLALVAAFVAGRYSHPVKVTETTETTATTEVAAHVEEKKDVAVATITKRTITERKRPSAPVPVGCPPCAAIDEKVTEEEVHAASLDRGTVTSDLHASSEDSTKATRVTESDRPGWRASFAAGWKPSSPSLDPSVYEVRVERRIVGTVWAGAWARTDKTAGVVVSMEW